MKKIIFIILLLAIGFGIGFGFNTLINTSGEYVAQETNKYLIISEEKIKVSDISTNGNSLYIVEFKLENAWNDNLQVYGHVKIKIGLVNETTVKASFAESIKSHQEIIIKVYITSPIDSHNASIEYIDIYRAKIIK